MAAEKLMRHPRGAEGTTDVFAHSTSHAAASTHQRLRSALYGTVTGFRLHQGIEERKKSNRSLHVMRPFLIVYTVTSGQNLVEPNAHLADFGAYKSWPDKICKH